MVRRFQGVLTEKKRKRKEREKKKKKTADAVLDEDEMGWEERERYLVVNPPKVVR